jgi:hypothetical protein
MRGARSPSHGTRRACRGILTACDYPFPARLTSRADTQLGNLRVQYCRRFRDIQPNALDVRLGLPGRPIDATTGRPSARLTSDTLTEVGAPGVPVRQNLR